MAAIIFDFDGTLADSFDVLVRAFYEVNKHSQQISEEIITELRGKSLPAILKKLDISWWQAPFLLVRGRRAMAKHIDRVRPFKGIPEVVKALDASHNKLFIMSTNSTVNVRQFLRTNNLQTYFTHVYGSVGLFGKAKKLRKIIKHNHLKHELCVYVGDEGRDIEAAHDVGVKSIAVAWGFSSVDLLEQLKPSAFARQPHDILEIIDSKD